MNQSAEPPEWKDADIARQLPGLQEILAQHVHDKWAERRTREGWSFGHERDDTSKKHPGLVPYEELSETEKAYDRATAFETLRVVLQHGYQIIPPTESVALEQSGAKISDALIRAHSQLSVSELITSFRARPPHERYQHPPFVCWVVSRLLEYSEPLLAFDLVSEALESIPGELNLVQLKGLSLARSGAAQKANAVFQELFDAGHRDEETLGNLARSYKSLWETARNKEEASRFLSRALETYQLSYDLTGGYWSGINVAFLALMKGDSELAHLVASNVREDCRSQLAGFADATGKYWLLATIAEATLILGDVTDALKQYKSAATQAGKKFGNLASTGRQAAKIAAKLGVDWALFSECFTVPQIIAFQSVEQFDCEPHEFEIELNRTIERSLDLARPIIAFTLCEHPTNLQFLECVQQLGGETAAVLSSDEFQSTTVDQQRIDSLLAKCREVHRLGVQIAQGGDVESCYAERILAGLASMHARQFGVAPTLLTLAQVDKEGEKFALVDHPGLGRVVTPDNPPRAPHSQDAQIVSIEPTIMSLLFADVKGFSRLKEKQLLRFAREFLSKVSEFMQENQAFPTTRHTWGDGLFLTFETVQAAGLFALNLADMVEKVEWESFGLPQDLSIRIGLHAGPVYECFDPISEKTTFMGIHVNHAARIEPITPPGNVYASEAFAALASEQQLLDFRCEYVGRTPLAKGFGMFSTYHVRQTTLTEEPSP